MMNLVNNWHNRKTQISVVTLLMHSMQEGHMDFEVVNIIHVSELFQPYEIKSFDWSLWLIPVTLLEFSLSYQLLYLRSLRLPHLKGKLLKYRSAGPVLSHSLQEVESQDGDRRLNLVLSYLDSWTPVIWESQRDRMIWLQHPGHSYWWPSTPPTTSILVPLSHFPDFSNPAPKVTCLQGWSPLKPILKETSCKLIWGLPNVGIVFILRWLQIHRNLQK